MKNFFGKAGEAIRKRPKTSIVTAVGILVAGTLIAFDRIGDSMNPTMPLLAGSCESPAAESKVYQNPDGSDFGLYTGTGEGVVLKGPIPPGAYGVRGMFKDGGPGEHEWIKSDVVPAGGPNSDDGTFALKFAIGKGAAKFGVQAVVDEEHQQAYSATCATPPEITEQHFPTGFWHAEGNHPWPQFGNRIFSAIG